MAEFKDAVTARLAELHAHEAELQARMAREIASVQAEIEALRTMDGVMSAQPELEAVLVAARKVPVKGQKQEK